MDYLISILIPNWNGESVLPRCLQTLSAQTCQDFEVIVVDNASTDGSVAYLFSRKGQLNFAAGIDEDQLMEVALEAGAEDVLTNDDGSVDVLTDPDRFVDVRDAMVAAGLEPENAEVTMRADNTIALDLESAEKMVRMLDRLEDLDDVQNVYSNADISEEILAQLG